MTEAGDRLLAGAREAVAIAKGEQPAARIWHQGWPYVPEPPTKDECIVAAAVLFRGVPCVLPPPARHHHILHAIHALHPDSIIGPDEQGFMTNGGRFVERAEARRIAVLAGQTDTTHRHLFSEDLW